LKSIAQSGPELQARLLQGLGLKSFLITDGNSPLDSKLTEQKRLLKTMLKPLEMKLN
jgi:major vault protein